MPGGKKPGPSVKHPAAYEAIKKKLRKKGVPAAQAKTTAAKISNAKGKK